METSNPFRRNLHLSRGPGLPVLGNAFGSSPAAVDPSLKNASGLAGGGDLDVPASTQQLSKHTHRRYSKPPPPVILPRKRGSRIEPLVPTGEQNTSPLSPSPPTSSRLDPFYADDEIVDASTPRYGINLVSPNPFLRRSNHQSEDAQGQLDDAELALGDLASSSAVATTRPHGPRQSLDVDAFKQLMLTGYFPQQPLTPTLESSIFSAMPPGGERSASEPIIEGEKSDTEIPAATVRVTSEFSLPAGAPLGSLSRSSSTRSKPPLPKPRSRSGGKPSLLLVVSPAQTATSSSPASTRPPSIMEIDRPQPPPLPPLAALDGMVEPEKKTSPPPPPPVSRRHSMQPRPPVAATEMQGSSKGLGSLAPPPLPPVRRTKSISSRSSDSGSAPPPPPPRKHKTNGIDSLEKPPVEDKDERTSDILVDLQKLQREVDELRGKYGSKATAGVAQAANKHQPDHSNLIMH